MKVNELMADNYVMVDGEIHQVCEINDKFRTILAGKSEVGGACLRRATRARGRRVGDEKAA